MLKATYTHTQAIKARAMNAAAREIRDNGILLTHDQCDDIGDLGRDWLRTRLGLRAVTSDAGVEFVK